MVQKEGERGLVLPAITLLKRPSVDDDGFNLAHQAIAHPVVTQQNVDLSHKLARQHLVPFYGSPVLTTDNMHAHCMHAWGVGQQQSTQGSLAQRPPYC